MEPIHRTPQSVSTAVATIHEHVRVFRISWPRPASLSEELDSPGGSLEGDIAFVLGKIEEALDGLYTSFGQIQESEQGG